MADILISKFTTQIPRVGATPATPGFAESEGQDPVAPSGTPQVYTPVTIGSPANGLSISGTQVLTIGLASTSATGALSSTDWNTFNGKLNLTSPITGYTVGANTALADTDTILQAFGKVQGQINARISGTIASGQVAFGTSLNTIGGDSGMTWDNSLKRFAVLSSGNQAAFFASTTATIASGQGTLNLRSTETAAADLGGVISFRANTTTLSNYTVAVIAGKHETLASGNFSGYLQFITTTAAGNPTEKVRITSSGLFGILTNAPTNTLDINGTARIRTISNLGSAATSVLVPSATGVVSLRTLAELSADMGNTWTSVGTGNIFRNSRISVGHTGDPVESIDLGTAGWLRTSNGASAVGGVLFPNGANAASRSWAIGSDLGGSFGSLCIRRSDTQAGSAKTGSVSLVIDNLGSIGVNGTPFVFGSFTYLDVYGRSTSQSGVLRLLTSNSSQGFQAYVNSSTFISQTIGAIPWTFGVNSGEQFRITASGNILFNTTTDLGFKHYFAGTTAFQGLVTFQENVVTDIAFGTVTGTKIGTATNQRLAFYGSTPIVKPSGDILTALSNLGLITSPTITQVDQFAVKTTASADQTLPSGVLTILDYDTTLTNNSTATYTVGTTGRITINTTGIYTITAGVVIEADAVTALESAFLGIFRNGDLVAISSINTTIAAGTQSGLSTSTILSLTATDIIDCRALVNSVGGVANGLARRLGTLLGANATQVNSLSITKNSM